MRISSPVFAGRHKERRIIAQAFEAAREGHGRALLMEGLAGTGKSRLAEYALGLAAHQGFLPLVGVAAEGQEGTPYGLLLDAFRRHLRRQRNELPAWLDVRSAWTELVTFRAPATLQGPQHAFHEISQALARHGAPVLLVLEDLHWADRASLDIVEWLVRELENQPIFLFATWRREGTMHHSDRAERIHRLRRRPGVEHLHLEGFSLADTREMVDGVMTSAGDHGFLVRQLHRRTGGNPLFLEELLHRIIRDGGGPDATLPVSFREAVRSRLTGLSREDLRLLQLASVIGEGFDRATLAYLGRRTEGAVAEALARLRDHQLIRETSDGSEFRFWHALTRDALYEQLLLPDRKALHRRIAQRWIAGADGESSHQPSGIAYHLENAGEKADAAPYYAAAAERAAALGAFDEAFAHGERAFAFSADDRGTKALHASRYARMAGHIDAALAYCRKAQSLLDDTGNPLFRAEMLLHESDLSWLNGNGARAGEILRAVAALRLRTGGAADASVWAWLLARTAHRACVESRWADALEPAKAAIAMSRRLRLPGIEAHALITRSMAEAPIEGFARAIATLQRGRALAERQACAEDICRSYVVEVDLRRREGDFAAACRTAVEGTERARNAGAPVILHPALAVSAVELLWKTGRWQEALDRIAETERLVNDQPSDLVRCHFRAVLAGIGVARHRLDEAAQLLEGALQLAQAIHESQWVLPVYVAAAELALAARKPDAARRHITEALQRFPDCDATEAAELRTLGLEAACEHHATSGRARQAKVATPGAAPARGVGRVANHHAKLGAGFSAMLTGELSSAARDFRQAAELAHTMGCPAAEARSRRWLAAALQKHPEPEARRSAVSEGNRAQALLAGIPGRGDHGSAALDMLSKREREVARLVGDGLANKEVGARLSISERTVAVHLSRIFDKVGVDSRHRLAALIAKTGAV